MAPSPRDLLIFQTIDRFMKIDPPNLGQAVVLMKGCVEEADIDTWFASWKAVREDAKRLEAFVENLRDAHERREYQVVIDELCADPRLTERSQDLTERSQDELVQMLQGVSDDFLEPLQLNMAQVVSGERGFDLWTPKGTGKHNAFLKGLKIPVDSQMKPDMLLHGLGTFSQDPHFRARLRAIFEPGVSVHKFLVNASGSGKTKLLLEGLSDRWGFYFTALRDTNDHGSSDMQNIINNDLKNSPQFYHDLPPDEDPAFRPRLESNRNIADVYFKMLLLARVRIFCMFVKAMEAVPLADREDVGEYRRRWLGLQLKPSMLTDDGSDIFDDLTAKFLPFAAHLKSGRARKIINKELQPFRADHNSRQDLYIVVDEIQHAAEMFFGAFRSDSTTGSTHDRGDLLPRPLLRQLLLAWIELRWIIVVFSGTGLSGVVVQETVTSAVAKYKKFKAVHETGEFKRVEVIDDARNFRSTKQPTPGSYMMQFMPPTLRIAPIIVELFERVSYWLTGRRVLNMSSFSFRFTAGYVSELLAAEFEHPHELLNAYIYELTTPPKPNMKSAIQTKNPTELSTIAQIVCRYWIRKELDNPMVVPDEAQFVEWGFARFLPSDTPNIASTRMDEPVALLALGQWFNAGFHESIYHRLAINIGCHRAIGENTLENYLAFCFAKLFSWKNHRLDEIFHFPRGAPAWAHQTAQIVSLHKAKAKSQLDECFVNLMSRPSYSIGTHAADLPATREWLKHERPAAICFPDTLMGPDLMFILRLQDGSRIWVAVQSKFASQTLLTAETLRGAIRSVTPKNYYSSFSTQKMAAARTLLKALPGRRADVGSCGVLRVVVSFPGETRVQRGATLDNMDFYDDEHPIASLNMPLLAEMTKDLAPRNFLSMVKSAPDYHETDFMDAVDGGLYDEDRCVHLEDTPPITPPSPTTPVPSLSDSIVAQQHKIEALYPNGHEALTAKEIRRFTKYSLGVKLEEEEDLTSDFYTSIGVQGTKLSDEC
ncbi:hypothetical protein C8R46DRAFT_1302822 [Mycena filopes]|nr:hypothetical protein C8R46DRAFT_1302822 [Mycena filopes]